MNNELNALIDIRNDLEVKIDEVKMHILKKKIEISEYSKLFLYLSYAIIFSNKNKIK